MCETWCPSVLTLPAAGQVRHWEGAEALDGIDTLLVHLLADADSAAALESFAAAPNEVRCRAACRPQEYTICKWLALCSEVQCFDD